jgi:hypothetical protein
MTLSAKIVAGDTLFEMLQSCPFYIFRMLFVIAAVLMKVLKSTYARFVDVDAGEQAFNTTISALRKSAIQENDKANRSADMLSQMWLFNSEMDAKKPEDPSLRFKSRLGNSLIYDMLRHWRDEMIARGQGGWPGNVSWHAGPTNVPGVDQGEKSQIQNLNPQEEVPANTAVNADLDVNGGSLDLPWDNIDIAFDWDWDVHGFTLPT